MNLLNNWLAQAIIANVVCYILGKIVKWFIHDLKSNRKEQNPTISKYSKKELRKEFYISLAITITCTPLFFFTQELFIKGLSFWGIFFGIFFMYCAFECSLECFNDKPSGRSK